MNLKRLVISAGLALTLVGCVNKTTYGIGQFTELSSHDAAIAFVQRNMPAADRDGAKFDQPLQPLSLVMPPYPPQLFAEKLAGKAEVRFAIDIDGRVKDIVIVTQTNPAFGQAVLDAVRQWRFTPITVGGEPRRIVYQVPFLFKAR